MSAGYLAKCARKKRHETRAEAEEHRAELVRLGKWRMTNSNTYRCNQCGCWHAGSIRRAPRGRR
jgi:rubrerythrin